MAHLQARSPQEHPLLLPPMSSASRILYIYIYIYIYLILLDSVLSLSLSLSLSLLSLSLPPPPLSLLPRHPRIRESRHSSWTARVGGTHRRAWDYNRLESFVQTSDKSFYVTLFPLFFFLFFLPFLLFLAFFSAFAAFALRGNSCFLLLTSAN